MKDFIEPLRGYSKSRRDATPDSVIKTRYERESMFLRVKVSTEATSVDAAVGFPDRARQGGAGRGGARISRGTQIVVQVFLNIENIWPPPSRRAA